MHGGQSAAAGLPAGGIELLVLDGPAALTNACCPCAHLCQTCCCTCAAREFDELKKAYAILSDKSARGALDDYLE